MRFSEAIWCQFRCPLLQEDGMPTAKHSLHVNKFLNQLASEDRDKIISGCEEITLASGTRICERLDEMEFVYFPVSGCIAMVIKVDNHQPLEIGLVGNEGLVGATALLGNNRAPFSAIVQCTGNVLRMPMALFNEALADISYFRALLNRYLSMLVGQLTQSAGCGHFHAIEPRLARWLLMTQDRVQTDHFRLTHEFLADMLGVRRSGITIAAGVLQKMNLISYTRGQIFIMDRKGLERASCDCYTYLLENYITTLESRC